MELNLQRPVAFFDLETTGINIAADRIIEISILKIYPDGNKESKTLRINPTIPISKSAIKVHGITDAEVANEPTFAEVAKSLAQYMNDCDLAGYNLNKFDIPLLMEEFLRADVEFDLRKRKIIDVQVIFHKMEQRTLSAAFKFYCGKELENAHSAKADTDATYEVLKAQLDKYRKLENDMAFLSDFSSTSRNVDFAGRIVFNDKDEEVFNFGKHKGKKVEDVLKNEPSYYSWMMNGDFPLYTKKVLTAIKIRTFGK